MSALLQQLGGGRQIPVDRAVVLIGRGPECDAVIDSSTKISRMHCALVQVDNDYYLRDLGSMNGVWIGGQKIVREQRLSNGTEVTIGDVRFLFLTNVSVPPVVGRGGISGEAQPLESTRPAASQDSSLGTVEQRPAGEERTVGAMPRLPVEEHGATLLVDPADDDLPVLELDEIELEVIDDP
jgi:pSer/pThr/pTyr-binding forkhead associated (FHA) protein